jgi:hypothetical protein
MWVTLILRPRLTLRQTSADLRQCLLKRPFARPYTGRVRAWVAVCVLLLPAAFARGAVHVDAPSITHFGNWEIEVSVDPETCEISCEYRLRRDRFGRAPVTDFLMPPAVDVRIYTDGARQAATVTFDPAHTREPVLHSDGLASAGEAVLPGSRVDVSPPPDPSHVRTGLDPARRSPAAPSVPRAASTPLRV